MAEFIELGAEAGVKLLVFPDGTLTDLAVDAQTNYTDEAMAATYEDSGLSRISESIGSLLLKIWFKPENRGQGLGGQRPPAAGPAPARDFLA